MILIVGGGCFVFWAVVCVACAAAKHKRKADQIMDGEEYGSDSGSQSNSGSGESSDLEQIPEAAEELESPTPDKTLTKLSPDDEAVSEGPGLVLSKPSFTPVKKKPASENP